MKDKEEIKQLKLSENLTKDDADESRPTKQKKEKEKPANKMWVVLILAATIFVSLFFRYLSGKPETTDAANPMNNDTRVLQQGEYAF